MHLAVCMMSLHNFKNYNSNPYNKWNIWGFLLYTNWSNEKSNMLITAHFLLSHDTQFYTNQNFLQWNARTQIHTWEINIYLWFNCDVLNIFKSDNTSRHEKMSSVVVTRNCHKSVNLICFINFQELRMFLVNLG